MKSLPLISKVRMAAALSLPLFVPVSVSAIELKANFRLFDEVSRFGIGYGDMALHFGVNGPAVDIGGFGFYPGGTPYKYGVMNPITLTSYGWNVVDLTFSVPFSVEVDQPASLYMGFGDNGANNIDGGDVQVIFDFADRLRNRNGLLGYTLDQGFSLVSVTLANGIDLSSVGLSFDFIPENTVLTAFASDFDVTGNGVIYNTAGGSNNRAAVFLGLGTASAKLCGGYNYVDSAPTEYLANLDVLPEPEPYVFDFAGATISGAGNVVLTRISVPTVPTPSTLMLLAAGFISWFVRRQKVLKGLGSDNSNTKKETT